MVGIWLVYASNATIYQRIYIFLKNKTTQVYKKALKLVKENSGNFKLQPKLIRVDFELAAINAFSDEFPEALIKGCYFHYVQALWKNIRDKGLIFVYKEKKVLSL